MMFINIKMCVCVCVHVYVCVCLHTCNRLVSRRTGHCKAAEATAQSAVASRQARWLHSSRKWQYIELKKGVLKSSTRVSKHSWDFCDFDCNNNKSYKESLPSHNARGTHHFHLSTECTCKIRFLQKYSSPLEVGLIDSNEQQGMVRDFLIHPTHLSHKNMQALYICTRCFQPMAEMDMGTMDCFVCFSDFK